MIYPEDAYGNRIDYHVFRWMDSASLRTPMPWGPTCSR